MQAIDKGRIEGSIFFAGFVACVPLANWLIGHIGTVCVPTGPCLVPVAPGIDAPSGVLMIVLALVLRDQRRLGLARRSAPSASALCSPRPSRRQHW